MRQLPYIRLFPNKYCIPTGSSQNKPMDCITSSEDTSFMDRLINNIEYVAIPERITESEKFVELAIEYSNLSEIAIEVKQLSDCIVVTYYFHFLLEENLSKDMLADLIKMCNSVDFYKPTDNETGLLKLALTYKTHDHYIRS